MPTVLLPEGLEDMLPSSWKLSGRLGFGTGGAFWRSHLRWVMAFLRRSWKMSPPPARKESLMTSRFWREGWEKVWRMGPGDSSREVYCSVKLCWGSWDSRGAPQSSQLSSDGWFKKVQRGHWNEASLAPGVLGSCDEGVVPRLCAKPGVASAGRPRIGIEDDIVLGAGRFDAPATAAFRTWARGGLIPQARHGGKGVRALASVGSKFEGTGLENVHIVQTHVALLAGGGSGRE